LVEVFGTVVIAAVVTLSVISGIIFSVKAQKMAREHSMAQRQAAELIEETRSKGFRALTNQIDDATTDDDGDARTRMVLIDDRQTDFKGDDLKGVARLKIFRADEGGFGTEVESALIAAAGDESETIQDFLLLQATVNWESMGQPRQVTLVSYMAPQ
jgi:type II secretory pathway pseudopilin PulG